MAPVLLLAAAAFAGLGGAAAWLAHDHAGRLVREGARAHSLARTDPMTGLPNRLAFTEHLACIERAGLPHVAVLFTDLNGFKRINDTVGHAGGDAVVAGLATRLAPLAGPDTFLARLGGDEFVWVLASDGGVAARAGALTEAVRARVAEPFPVLGQLVRLSLSQGLALRDAPDVALDELVRRADLAMYRAKRDRSALAQPWSPDLDNQGGRDRDLERALRDALARPHEFTLHYQPIVDATTHAVRRAEALARWRSPVLGQVPPDRFIAAAEAVGLMGELGRLLLDRVAADLARAPGLLVGVNLSPLQLVDPAFAGDAAAILARHGVEPARIELELTESILIDSAETAAMRLDALSEMGFSLALDDFGTGFSSIGTLRRMPFDTLKIDRASSCPTRAGGRRSSRPWRALAASSARSWSARGWRRKRRPRPCGTWAATSCRATASAGPCRSTRSWPCQGSSDPSARPSRGSSDPRGRGSEAQARVLVLELRHAAAGVEEARAAPGPGGMREGVDVELHRVALLAPGRAHGDHGPVRHAHGDRVVVGMDAVLHRDPSLAL
jgi:diguanylate cyclase (GGDEF)-like protein